MYPTHVVKIGSMRTPWGNVVVLMVEAQRVIAFPSLIDTTDSVSIDALYSTLEWPLGWPISRLVEFPQGTPLAGWDILGADNGALFEDPALDNIINRVKTPSLTAKRVDRALQLRFNFAKREVKAMNAARKKKKMH